MMGTCPSARAAALQAERFWKTIWPFFNLVLVTEENDGAGCDRRVAALCGLKKEIFCRELMGSTLVAAVAA